MTRDQQVSPRVDLRVLDVDVAFDSSTSGVTSEGKEEGSLKAKRNSLVRGKSRGYASNFCKAAQTS